MQTKPKAQTTMRVTIHSSRPRLLNQSMVLLGASETRHQISKKNDPIVGSLCGDWATQMYVVGAEAERCECLPDHVVPDRVGGPVITVVSMGRLRLDV
jgi:hypothetical protein